jgi:hypothetical protein
MDERDASSSEMPGFPFPRQPGCELGEPLLDALLEGRSLPPDAPGEARAVAQMLADLAGPAEPGELAGEAAARSVLARSGPPARSEPPVRVRTPVRVGPGARLAPRRRSWAARWARPAAALIAATVGLGGTAAAYAGALPGPIQNFAHHAIGAPPTHGAGPIRPHPGQASPGPAGPGQPRPGRHKGQATPGAATPGHRKGLPPQAHGKAKGHARPGPAELPPGQAKDKAHAPKPNKHAQDNQAGAGSTQAQ